MKKGPRKSSWATCQEGADEVKRIPGLPCKSRMESGKLKKNHIQQEQRMTCNLPVTCGRLPLQSPQRPSPMTVASSKSRASSNSVTFIPWVDNTVAGFVLGSDRAPSPYKQPCPGNWISPCSSPQHGAAHTKMLRYAMMPYKCILNINVPLRSDLQKEKRKGGGGGRHWGRKEGFGREKWILTSDVSSSLKPRLLLLCRVDMLDILKRWWHYTTGISLQEKYSQ